MKKVCVIFFAVGLIFTLNVSKAQYKSDEAEFEWKAVKELKYQAGLPDPFLKPDGTRVETKEEWLEQRDYIKAMLQHYQYGTMPPRPENLIVRETLSEDLFNGLATRILYKLTIHRKGKNLDFHFGIIKPKGDGPFPVIIKNDRDVPDPINHDKKRLQSGSLGIPHVALFEAVKRGYIYCAYDREDLGSDIGGEFEKNRDNGVFPLYPEYDWGTIAAWAWGYQLIIDYFETLDFIDIGKIVVTGHSRGGKTAFCGGIYDERIAITAPNSSGLGGTSSHLFDELKSAGKPNMPPQIIAMHIASNPHWWTSEYYKLSGYEPKIPFDAHFGKAVIAPRAFFNTHAYQDYHANPLGAWLTMEAAKKVYEWLGAENNIAMHFRTGGHAQSIIDWFALFDFCDKYFYNKPSSSPYDTKYDFNKVNPYPWATIPVNWEVPEEN